jgi:hypothetical protein
MQIESKLGVLVRMAGIAALAAALGCREPVLQPELPSKVPAPGTIRFENVAGSANLSFTHFDPATPEHLIHETMGSGIAWIDYDADGWPDLLCVQSGPVPPRTIPDPPTHRLYRNLHDGTFADVTSTSGLGTPSFGMGAAVGDIDNDGFDDVAITHLGGISLYHNVPDGRGGRRFDDITNSAGLAGTNPHWATSGAWGDLDGDGLLDLYVCNYVETDPANPIVCRERKSNIAHACPPTAYPSTTHRLYRNLGGGKFDDVSMSSGVGEVDPAAGLAVVIVDLDDDGRPDIYVANDMYPAYLFHNETPPGGPITLVERAGLAGCSLGPNGTSMSGMCVEAAEVDGSGRAALFVTNFQGQPNVLFQNLGRLQFSETVAVSGLGMPSRDRLGFGAAFLDADLDGHLDLAVANGHVYRSAPDLLEIPYAQETQLFRGSGDGTFREVGATAGDDFRVPRVGRGLARADFDNDGLPDLAVSTVGGPLALFRNVTSTPHHWIGLELAGSGAGSGAGSNRSAIGAIVTVEAGGLPQTHFVSGGGSYLSAHDRRLTVGLGSAEHADRVRIRWPSGDSQDFAQLKAGTYYRLEQGRFDSKPTR